MKGGTLRDLINQVPELETALILGKALYTGKISSFRGKKWIDKTLQITLTEEELNYSYSANNWYNNFIYRYLTSINFGHYESGFLISHLTMELGSSGDYDITTSFRYYHLTHRLTKILNQSKFAKFIKERDMSKMLQDLDNKPKQIRPAITAW